MNRIKSLLGLLSIVLALMSYPLGAEAQTVTVPPGTNTSVRLLGQIYVETGDQMKESQDIDKMSDYATEITTKYAPYIDTNVKLNNSDRKYLLECMMYLFTQSMRIAFISEGVNPDDPDIAPYYNQALEDASKSAEGKLAGAKTMRDVFPIIETIFE